MSGYVEKIAVARKSFASGRTKSISFRKKQLQQLLKFINNNESAIVSAVSQDLHRPKAETILAETVMTSNAIVNVLDNIDEWVKDEGQSKTLLTMFSDAKIRKQPYGVCLIISAWNYPVVLLLIPVISAIAAGNCVIVKPSECAENTAKLLLEELPKYLDPECYPVVVTDATGSADLVKNNRFDLIFFTGGTSIGRSIMRCAAEFLTPVVLELGGKNPCFVDSTTNIKVAARRICWGRFLNCGQICIAPDYILCEANVLDDFIHEAKAVIEEFFGPEPQKSPDYSRIINERQMKRLTDLIKGNDAKIVHGGKFDMQDKYIAPTIVRDVTLRSKFMQQEMFGPILLVMSVANVDEAISTINKLEKPLAVYAFSNDRSAIDKLLFNTSSGGVTINDVTMHYTLDSLPFGGVGESGMGSYHGKFGFDAFTHKRAVLVDGTPEAMMKVRYAPYNESKISQTKFLIKKSPKSKGFVGFVKSFFCLSLIGVLAAFVLNALFTN